MTTICLLSCLEAFFVNPGTVFSSPNIADYINKRYCGSCSFYYPNFGKEVIHCEDCGVCLLGHDHHCAVFGKCVAKYNYWCFNSFVVLLSITLVTTFCGFFYLVHTLQTTKG